MTFEEFVSEEPVGLASSRLSGYPLWIAPHADIISEVADFSVIDDFMTDHDIDDFEAEFADHFPSYVAFAACDVPFAMEVEAEFVYDSYAEFFLVVDTSDAARPVLLWTGESGFRPMFDSFEAFHASLVTWNPDDN